MPGSDLRQRFNVMHARLDRFNLPEVESIDEDAFVVHFVPGVENVMGRLREMEANARPI